MKLHKWLTLFVLVGSALLLWMNLSRYPIGNGRDEIDHAKVIEFYRHQWRFPVLPDDWADTSIEGHQPPLYYALMAGLMHLLDLPDSGVHTYFQQNHFVLYANYEPNLPPYNRVLHISHWAAQHPPYLRTLQLLRGAAVFLSIGGIFFTWLAACELLQAPYRRWAAPLMLAFLTLTPSFWRTASVINNDRMIFFLAALATYLLARVLRRGLDWRVSLGLGLALGLGLLSKIYMAPLVATTPLIFAALPRPAWKKAARHLLVIGAITAGLAGWWYWRNYGLYGEFTGAGISEDLLRTRRDSPINLREIVTVCLDWSAELWLESWLVINTAASRQLAAAVGTALIISSFVGLRKKTVVRGGWVLLVGAFLPALGLAVIGAGRNTHGHYSPPIMLSALPSIAMLFSLGVLAWVPGQKKPLAAATISAVLLIVVGTLVFSVTSFLPLFPPLERVENVDELAVANRLHVDFENGARLVGWEVESAHLHPGERSRVKLCWQATSEIDTSTPYAFTVKLVLPDHPAAAAQDGYPLSGAYPTTAWQPGTAFCEWVPLWVQADAITPRAYDLFVGMYVFEGEQVYHYTANGERDNYLVVGRVGVTAAAASAATSPTPTVGDWGGLAAAELDQNADTLTLSLDWVGVRAAPGRYHYYLHALDARGEIIAQQDQAPLGGNFPTDFWQAGVTFSDALTLAVPEGVTQLKFGLYEPSSGVRALWSDGSDGLVFPVQ